MPNVLVRDVPEGVHAELQRRAAQRGQSLQQYLAAELERLADKPTLEDVLQRIESHREGQVGLRKAADELAEMRDER